MRLCTKCIPKAALGQTVFPKTSPKALGSRVRQELIDIFFCHQLLYQAWKWPASCSSIRQEIHTVLLARLRAGHTPLLKAYVNQLDMTIDPKCHSCGEEPQTVEHWLQRCPNAVALRQQLFGEPSPPLSVLTTNTSSVLAHARKTLLLGP